MSPFFFFRSDQWWRKLFPFLSCQLLMKKFRKDTTGEKLLWVLQTQVEKLRGEFDQSEIKTDWVVIWCLTALRCCMNLKLFFQIFKQTTSSHNYGCILAIGACRCLQFTVANFSVWWADLTGPVWSSFIVIPPAPACPLHTDIVWCVCVGFFCVCVWTVCEKILWSVQPSWHYLPHKQSYLFWPCLHCMYS